jgi:hypothetical protein
LFVWLQFLAASDQFHRQLHFDAQSPSHTCAVTLLAQQGIEPASSHDPLPAVPEATFASPPPALLLSLIADPLLPPGRAPPVV